MNDSITKVEKIVIIVTVIIVCITLTGITYAFFTTSDNNGSTAEIITDSGKMIITYADGGNNLLVSDNISPSNKIIADKTFTLTGLNTATAEEGLTMPYKVGLKYTSSFSDGQIHYYIKKISSTNEDITTSYSGITEQTILGYDTETGYATGTLYKNVNYLEIVNGKFPASDNEQSITFNLKLQFPDTGENQDTEKGKSVNAMVVVNYDQTVSQHIVDIYNINTKDENGITIDGLQKDGTGSINQTLLSSSNNKYSATLLNKTLADTETDEYDNLRYVGANPNNYISFNNEVWRIIGLFNVYNNDTNKYEKLIKIIRNEKIGNFSWDTTIASINDGYGINEWSQAKLMYELNCDGDPSSTYCSVNDGITDGYLSNLTNGTIKWYNGANNNKEGIYDYSKNIKSGYVAKIANVRWNLGATARFESVKNYYIAERGTNHVNNPSDGITRTDYWDGKVGLMYPSDYGYASTDDECRSNLYNCANYKTNNWLFNNAHQWTLSSYLVNTTATFSIYLGGAVEISGPHNANGVRPTLFLKSNIHFKGGTGTSTDPYIID